MITPELISAFLGKEADWQGKEYYLRCNELREGMLPHSRGVYPERLENLVRPGETLDQKQYRKDIWKEITYPAYLQIATQEQKIRDVKGWSTHFPEQGSSLIRKGQGLEEYINKDFPVYDNLDNYLFSDVRQTNNEDANGVIAVYPVEYQEGLEVSKTDYLRPFPYVYISKEVLDFKEGKYAVILRTDKSVIKTTNGDKEGNIFVIITDTEVGIFTQTSEGSTEESANYSYVIYPHLSGTLPVWKLGSHIQDEPIKGNKINKTPLEAFRIPADEALMRYSDVQIQWNNAVHAEKVIFGTICPTCNGQKKLPDHNYPGKKLPTFSECHSCRGSGTYVPKVGPLNAYVYNSEPSQVGREAGTPNSPVSYVQKPFESTKMLDDNYRQLIQDGLTGLGLGYLNQTLLNVSGKKTELDRQEINTFFRGVATRLGWHKRWIIYYCNMQRYWFVQDRVEYFNQIIVKVPETFDILSSEYYQAQYIDSINNKESAVIRAEKAKEYARKEYGEGTMAYKKLVDSVELDPYLGLNEAEKLELLATDPNNVDLKISQKIEFYLNRAYAENENFFELTFAEKTTKLTEYAQAELTRRNVANLPAIEKINEPLTS